MKIALACQSVLLEKSLEIFLKSYITPCKQCDFLISDRKIETDKPLFYIATKNSDLTLPFSKSTLMLEIGKFHDSLSKKETKKNLLKLDMKELESKISKLTDLFKDDLLNLIKGHYDNQEDSSRKI